MKTIMMSIRPEWCELIAKRQKTIEVRKTKPKCDVPFKVYIYCTKNIIKSETFTGSKCEIMYKGCGKVIGEFICDSIKTIESYVFLMTADTHRTCMTLKDMRRYAGARLCLYGWHISNLKIYDKPKELSEFYKTCNHKCFSGCEYYRGKEEDPDCPKITRPPQSWCYVEGEV